MKPISYYTSIPIPEKLLQEIDTLNVFQRYMLCSALFNTAALKECKNFGAAKYSYAVIRPPECRIFAMTNSYLDVAELAAAIGFTTNDIMLNK